MSKKFKIVKFLNGQILISFFAFFLILSIVVFGNQFYLVLNNSYSQGILGSELLSLMSLKYVRDIPLILNLSFIFALIFSINKLHRSSELIILSTAGYGDIGIFKLLIPINLIFVFVVTLFAFLITPEVNRQISLIKNDANSRPDFIFFRDGVFQNFQNKNLTFYASEIKTEGDNQIMKNVFIFSDLDKRLILSNRGEKYLDKYSNKIYLKLSDGKIYKNFTSLSSDNFSVSTFKNLDFLLYDQNTVDLVDVTSIESRKTLELFNSFDKKSKIEIFNRLSVPVSLLIMTILSVQFSRANPRGKSNFALAFGLITYLTYFNILTYVSELKFNNENEITFAFSLIHLSFLLIVFIIQTYRNNLFFNNTN